MPVIESMLRRVATFDPAAAEARQRYLQALGKLRNPAERLELAYLLLGAHREALTASGSGGAGGTNGSGGSGGSGVAPGAGSAAAPATQARELLKGLDAWTGDAASRQFVRLVQALAQRSAELAQTRSALGKAQRKAADLEDKIGQIKNLEVQLQGRSQDRNAVRARPDR